MNFYDHEEIGWRYLVRFEQTQNDEVNRQWRRQTERLIAELPATGFVIFQPIIFFEPHHTVPPPEVE